MLYQRQVLRQAIIKGPARPGTDFDSILVYTTLGLCENQFRRSGRLCRGHLHVPLEGLGFGEACTNNYKSEILEPQDSSS